MKKLLVKNIGMLATPQGKSARSGAEQGEIQILKDAWVLIEDGLISQVGTGAAPEAAGAEVVDAKGRLVTPGLVDAHTHLIFGGWRQNELGMNSPNFHSLYMHLRCLLLNSPPCHLTVPVSPVLFEYEQIQRLSPYCHQIPDAGSIFPNSPPA